MKLAWEVSGNGPQTLMLLHGFTGSRRSWDHVAPTLSEQFRLIRVDLPGHGESPLPTKPGREGFLETLEALAQVLSEVGVESANVLGYSQGARVALAFTVEHPERVERLVLESGNAGLHRRKDRIARRRDDEKLADQIVRGGVEAFVSRWESLPLFAGLRRLPEAVQQALRARRSSATAEGLAGALRCLGVGVQPDYWHELWNLRRPTLLLTGAEDLKYTAIARRMAADLPMVWSHAFAGIGHAPHLECPEDWAREVTSFLQTPWYEAPLIDADLRSTA